MTPSVSPSPAPTWDQVGWREQASCRSSEADIFFPVGSMGIARVQIEAAKAVCRSCVVSKSCLEFALETNQEAGIWGGLDEDERRRLRRVWRKGRGATDRTIRKP